MYCLIEKNGNYVKPLAVSKHACPLIYKLRETAKDFVRARYDGEVLEDMLHEIELSVVFWRDDDYYLTIDETEEI